MKDFMNMESHTVTVRNVQDMQHIVETPHHNFVTDEFKTSGDSKGPSPFEVLLASLST